MRHPRSPYPQEFVPNYFQHLCDASVCQFSIFYNSNTVAGVRDGERAKRQTTA
jgi:hypothetical protein